VTTALSSCPNCGATNAEGARFCSTCGTALAGDSATGAGRRETRKTVTVLFADVAGSTALGEALDPESLRAVMTRYFADMKGIIERHGGQVEKFIGDAVMAVFGMPVAHEDDALRAVRAAADIRDRLVELNAELQHSRGIEIRFRTGVNTGEVVAGYPASADGFVTGDTVNTAARLEQNAPPGEVLLGAPTYRLVRDAVEVEPVEPIAAKGKAQPVAAWKLISVRPDAAGHARHLERPLVGRERELNRLRRSLDDAIADERCVLFTLLGPAGIGKSRLVQEFVSGVGDLAAILKGRCLPYGEGITYWPVAEIVRAAAGVADEDDHASAVAKVHTLVADEPDGPEIASTLATAIGLTTGGADRAGVFRAFRRFIESIARQQPVVVIFDDIHWAEPTLLDLIEHLVDWSRGRPILVLAVARPEFLDLRPGWAGGKVDAQTQLLEPLGTAATGELTRSLLGDDVDATLAERIETVAEGNPLFVEQLVAMLVEDGLVERVGDQWRPSRDLSAINVPPTISALLAARLDRLPRDQRQVAERASVVGRIFERVAVAELSPQDDRETIPESLQKLVRAELIRPETAATDIDETFRFRHILIRDAAYDSLPKRERADLHASFAGWLERTRAERLAEYEEILAYHLDQAVRFRSELGIEDHETVRLRRAAAAHFEQAGERAFNRGDPVAGIGLLARATELQKISGPISAAAILLRATALMDIRRTVEARDLAVEAENVASHLGDEVSRHRARVLRTDATLMVDPAATMGDLRTVLDEAFPVLEQAGHARGLVEAWLSNGTLGIAASRYADAVESYERSRAYALRAGLDGLADIAGFSIVQAMSWGPTPAAEGLARADELIKTATTRRGRTMIRLDRAMMLAFLGRFEEAGGEREAARRELEEMTGGEAVWSNMGESEIARAQGDFGRSVELLTAGRANLERVGDVGTQSTVEGLLSISLAMVGRDDEAIAMSEASERHASSDDAASQIRLHTGRGLALGHLGRFDEALHNLDKAVARARETDYFNAHAEALEAQSEVLRLSGRDDEAARSFDDAVVLYRRKGNLAALRRLGIPESEEPAGAGGKR
jgi:class 3 adenylate cyclase/tetratricopeptide (TPR) repeat protein